MQSKGRTPDPVPVRWQGVCINALAFIPEAEEPHGGVWGRAPFAPQAQQSKADKSNKSTKIRRVERLKNKIGNFKKYQQKQAKQINLQDSAETRKSPIFAQKKRGADALLSEQNCIL